jgi:hypothetical protein
MTQHRTHAVRGTAYVPACIGDLVVIERHQSDSRTSAGVLVGVVSATRHGKITAVDTGHGPTLTADLAAAALHLVPRRQIDVDAAIAEVRMLAVEDGQTQPFPTVEEVRALLQAFRRDLDPTVLQIPAPTTTAAVQS